MLNLSTQNILLLTAIVVAVELGIFAILLRRQNLFRWTSAGFWAWASFALYFAADLFQIRLSLSDGTSMQLSSNPSYLGFSLRLPNMYLNVIWRERKICN